MNLVKDSKGVTLTALIITIIVLMIVAGVAIYTGADNISKVEDETILTELAQVQHFVGENYLNFTKTNNESLLVGTAVSDSDVSQIASSIGITLVTIPNSYYSSANVKKPVAVYKELDQTQLEELGVENSKYTYIVNYLTGEVINTTKRTTSKGEALYSYIRNSFNNNNDLTSF